MAELQVVKKKKSLLPWILLFILLLGLAAYLFFKNGTPQNSTMQQGDSGISYNGTRQSAP